MAFARTAGLVLLLASATAVISFSHLREMPTYITRDEVFVGLTSYSIATTGRDLNGQFMPVVFWHEGTGSWWAPTLMYATAAMLKFASFNETSVRAPMAIAAVINVLLVFVIGRMIFRRNSIAFFAAALLALTPAHVIEQRYADDESLPITFALVATLALLTYWRTDQSRWLFIGGLVLGLGSFSYVGAAPLFPLYVAFVGLVLLLRREGWRRVLTFAVGSLIPIAIAAVWAIEHPEAIRTTLMHYQADENQSLATSNVMSNFATVQHAGEVATLYANFWDPHALFVVGGHTGAHTTGKSGVLLVAMAGLLLVGIVRAFGRSRSDVASLLLLGGFLIAPIPASFFPDFNDHLARHATWRAMSLFPFAALLAGLGLDYVLPRDEVTAVRRWELAWWTAFAVPIAIVAYHWSGLVNAPALLGPLLVPPAAVVAGYLVGRAPVVRDAAIAAVAALTVALLLQFADFYRDYLDDYRYRFIPHTDGNVTAVFDALIDRSPVARPGAMQQPPPIYLGFSMGALNWSQYYWRFYLHKYEREDLLTRTINDNNATRFGRHLVCSLPPDSLLAIRNRRDAATDALVERLSKQGELKIETVTRTDTPYWVLRTTGSCATAE